MRSVWIVVIAMMLQGCGARFHLTRALAKDPSLADTTIVIKDTMIVTENVLINDTITLLTHDTIVRIKDRIVTRFKRVSDTLWYEVECPSDTIEIVTQTQSISIEQPKRRFSWESKIVLTIWIFVFTLIIGKTIVKKIFK